VKSWDYRLSTQRNGLTLCFVVKNGFIPITHTVIELMKEQIKAPYTAIVISWVLFGLILGSYLLFYVGFLAGGSFLVIVMSVIIMLIAPPINIALFKHQKYQGESKLLVSVILTFVAMLLVLFILVMSGIFNFT